MCNTRSRIWMQSGHAHSSPIKGDHTSIALKWYRLRETLKAMMEACDVQMDDFCLKEGKRCIMWDDEKSGFFLVVTPRPAFTHPPVSFPYHALHVKDSSHNHCNGAMHRPERADKAHCGPCTPSIIIWAFRNSTSRLLTSTALFHGDCVP